MPDSRPCSNTRDPRGIRELLTNWESESIAKTASKGDKTSWGVPRTGGDPEEGDWSLLGGLSNEVSLELETADSRGHQADQGRV